MQSTNDRVEPGAPHQVSPSPATDASYNLLAQLFRRGVRIAYEKIESDCLTDPGELHEHGARVHLAMLQSSEDGSMAILRPSGVVACWYASAGDRERRGSPVRGRHVAQFYEASDVAEGLPQRHLKAAIVQGHSSRYGWRLSAAGSRCWSITDIRSIIRHDGTLAGFVHVIRPICGSWEGARATAPRPWSSAGDRAVPAYANTAVAA
ncbi:MAG TPA: hypothetical protein VNS57_12105 [Steroidobacteraceae bacterium]|nr:hypothetical protein [Steroidobacteraceae bacterium]